MRESFGNSFDVRDGVLIGINLGSDYCSEHERGIEDIYQSFGCVRSDPDILGIESRLIRKIPNNFSYFKNKFKNRNYHHLILSRYSITNFDSFNPVGYLPKELVTAWSYNSFGISVYKNKDYKNYLEELYESFLKKDIAIYYVINNSKNPFERPGLYIGISSKISEEDKDKMYSLDYDSLCLKKEFDKCGIYKRLKENNLPFLALEPRWVKDMDHLKFITDHPIVCWLNTYSKDYNSGWYTIEELDLWINGVGPVPINKSSLSKDLILRKD
jgi:hypothetical protein